MTHPPRAARRVHPAVQGFDRAAPAYERGRPGYPKEAVRYLARELGLRRGRTVVELASGTGKFTRALLPTGATIVPVEPTRGMREEFSRRVPDLPVLDGVAEAIPVPDAFADAIVCAQAFHWFRPRAALREIARALAPGGGLGLVWNRRDESVEWVHALTRIVDRYGWKVPRTRQRRWKRLFETHTLPFTPLKLRTFRFSQRLTPTTIVPRFLSVSCIAVQSPAEQRSIATEIRKVVREAPETRGRAFFDLPYRTEVYTTRATVRRPGSARASQMAHHRQRAQRAGAGRARPS